MTEAATYQAAPIAPTAIIGTPFRPLLDGRQLDIDRAPVIAEGVWIGHYTTVGPGATVGAGSILEDFVGIEPGAQIGSRVLVTSRSWIGIGATVGDNSVIKGYIGDHARIGTGCRIFGDLIHRQLDPSVPWDDPAAEEPAPIVADGAFVGWRAVIVGGVNIGAGAYVCAGALITKDVPAGCIAYGRNKFTYPRSWPGALGKSPFFYNPRHSRKRRLPERPRRPDLALLQRWRSTVEERARNRPVSLAGPQELRAAADTAGPAYCSRTPGHRDLPAGRRGKHGSRPNQLSRQDPPSPVPLAGTVSAGPS
jgi:acetyltransferase-like isoleucine patch superfamily enzyme